MKILFIGLGSIGRRHANLIQLHYPEHKLFALRSGKGRYGHLRGVEDVSSWDELDSIPDVAFICNPTNRHLATVQQCIEHGITRIFLEKPIDCIAGSMLDSTLDRVEKKKAIVYVAYPMRFHSEIEYLKKLGLNQGLAIRCSTNVHLWPTYRKTPQEGGGALLELSHEVDYATYLLGKISSIKGSVQFKNDLDNEVFLAIEHGNNLSIIFLELFGNKDKRSIQGHSFKWKIKPQNSSIYLKQLQYYFDNMDNLNIMNNIFEASDMFRKLIEFREGQYRNSNNHMLSEK